MNPSNLKYSATHEWVGVNGDVATIGITDYAQSEVGEIVFVELPNVGDKVNKGNTLCTLESYKTVSDLYSPVSGEVVEVNTALTESPQLVNESAFDQGWVVKLSMSNPDELGDLMDAEQYMNTIETH